jgi:uncharacterized protein involved in cysteine biosynthesis
VNPVTARVSSFWYGLSLPWQALKLILRRPVLLAWSLVPIALTLALYAFGIRALQGYARSGIFQVFASHGWDTHGWIAGFVLLLTRLLMLFVGAVTFSFVASVVSSPFNDFLAEAAEPWTIPPLPRTIAPGLGMRARLILVDLSKAIAATLATLIAIAASWIPVLNLVALLFALLLVTFQYISYAQTRRGLGLREGAAFLWRHGYACLGFGAMLSLLFAIPVVASFALPLAVVGGTLLVGRAQGAPLLK